MFMIMLILDNPDHCTQLMEAWHNAGASGITILPSTGLGRMAFKYGLQDDHPLMPSLEEFYHHEEESNHRTLISVVRDRAVVDKMISATQQIIGDLNKPRTGILVVLPVIEAYGLDRYDAP